MHFNLELFKVSIIQTKLFGPLDFELLMFHCTLLCSFYRRYYKENNELVLDVAPYMKALEVQFVFTLTTLGKFSRGQIDVNFLILLPKKGFDISCRLSPEETIFLKCQILFSGKRRRILVFQNVVC